MQYFGVRSLIEGPLVKGRANGYVPQIGTCRVKGAGYCLRREGERLGETRRKSPDVSC